MDLSCERRVDCKGRDYFFLRPVEVDDSLMSATVFPAPSGTTTAIYIWWRKGKSRWVKRYLWSNEKMIPFVGREVVRVLDQVMSEMRFHQVSRARWNDESISDDDYWANRGAF